MACRLAAVVAGVLAQEVVAEVLEAPRTAKAALIFDEHASDAQRAALEGFAKEMGGELIETVVRRDAAPIRLTFEGSIHERRATVEAGDLVRIETRPIHDSDSLCHLDDLYYTPLVNLDHAMPAFGVQTMFAGEGLGIRLDERNRSNSYIGTFTLGSAAYTD